MPLSHQDDLMAQALSRCAAEVIHRPGTIQPHGCMIVMDEMLIIRHASQNILTYIGKGVDDVLGTRVADLLGNDLTEQCRGLLQLREPGHVITIESEILREGFSMPIGGQAHFLDDLIYLELEPASGKRQTDLFQHLFIPIRDKLWNLEAENQLTRYMSGVAEQIAALTSIDRVMVYRFDSEWDGEVIAECRNADVESFLGHHFPASDIPPQARELYLKNTIRLISDVHAEPVPVLPPLSRANGLPLDLSHVGLRSFSPVHLEYLKNMGVSASLSISLIANGRLWGLIACHHYRSFSMPFHIRELADFVGRTASMRISDIEQAERQARMAEAEEALAAFLRVWTGPESSERCADSLLRLLDATGCVISCNHKKYHFGTTPDLAFTNHLADWLRSQSVVDYFATDRLPERLASHAGAMAKVKGLFAIPTSPDFENYVLWFREGIVQSIRWAGNPEKTIEASSDGVKISPRKSFGAWIESYEGRSKSWTFSDLDIGQRMSIAVLTRLTETGVRQAEQLSVSDLMLPDDKVIVGTLDSLFAYRYVSPNVASVIGFQNKELCGHPVSDFIFSEDAARVCRYFEQTVSGDSYGQSIVFRHCRKDGRYIWMELQACKAASVDDGISFIAKDVSERQRFNANLEELHRRYKRVTDVTLEGVLIADSEGLIMFADTACQNLLGFSKGEASRQKLADLFANGCPGRLFEEVPDLTASTNRLRMTRRHAGVPRECTTTRVLLSGLLPNEPRLVIIVGAQAATESDRDEASETPHSVDSATETAYGVMVTDKRGNIAAVNHGFSEITGFQASEAIGQSPSILRSDVHSQDFYKRFWQTLATSRHWQGEIWNRRKNGEIYPQLTRVFSIVDAEGIVQNYVSIFKDVSTVVSSGEQAHSFPEHDPLTGLPTRILFERMVEKEIGKGPVNFAIAFIDLDNFKEVNDALGHITGDRLLYLISNRMSGKLRGNDRIGRWGGDKFVVLLPGISNQVDALSVMTRHLESLAQPFSISGKLVRLQARVGISLYPRDGVDHDELMRAADLAQGQAKKEGPGTILFYESRLATATANRFALANDLRQAIQSGQLFLHYQPQVDAETGAPVGLEALVRWAHPVRGLIPPSEFIELAEESNLIEALGNEVFRMACAQICQWSASGDFHLTVGINVSPFQLKPGLVETMKRCMDEYRIDPCLIEIEITESALQPTTQIRQIIQEIKLLGVSLAIDDFGTGYSSLSHLKLFQFDRLKIDKSFVDGLPSNPDDLAIAQAIVALGKALKVSVLAEGVEDSAQALCLRSEGVEVIQGFYYDRPLSVADIDARIKAQRGTSPCDSLRVTGE